MSRRSSTGQRIAGHPHRQAGSELGEMLLGGAKVDKDRVEGLQRDDRVPFAEHLPEIHLPDAETAAEGGRIAFFPMAVRTS